MNLAQLETENRPDRRSSISLILGTLALRAPRAVRFPLIKPLDLGEAFADAPAARRSTQAYASWRKRQRQEILAADPRRSVRGAVEVVLLIPTGRLELAVAFRDYLDAALEARLLDDLGQVQCCCGAFIDDTGGVGAILPMDAHHD